MANHKKNLFEMGTDFGDDWSSDNKDKPSKEVYTEIKIPEKHQLHFAKEKRRGKVITIVKPFYLTKSDLQVLVKTLKKKLGAGGTIKEDSLELQGDIPKQVQKHLESMGYHFKN
ncbi:MAG: translation initiation factor [Sulfurovum sp.]|nr:MAG: translation initiation factor [Sulfurovum sp.]